MRIKNRLLYTLIISFFTYQDVIAEVIHWPQLCATGELHLKNKSTRDLPVWLQKFGKTLIRETEVLLDAKSTLIFQLEEIKKAERYSLLNIYDSQTIEVKYKCNDRLYTASSLEGGALTFKKSDLLVNTIWVQNLFTDTNEVEIEFQDSDFQKITTKNIRLSASTSILFAVPDSVKNWFYFKISASHKSSVFNLTSNGNDQPVIIAPQKTLVETSAFYFLVGPRVGSADSFVVKITEENLAEKARDLIKNPQKEKMLFARIQKDHQGFNRNWSKTEKNFWSWSTSEVTNFADLGSTACNGAPQEVEDRIDYWVSDPGQICFWNYRIKKELTAHEVSTGQ